MKIHPLELASSKLEPSIWLTAEKYPEGTAIVIVCLSRSAKRTEIEVAQWLKLSGKKLAGLDKFLKK